MRRPTIEELEERAECELAAYFARRRVAATRTAEDEAVEAIFASIRAYHRGVLSLYHDKRSWPEGVVEALGPWAAIGVRLDCADHPAAGSTRALEQVAAQRIAALFATEGKCSPTLIGLHARASIHVKRAMRAYARALRSRLVRKP